MNKTIIPDMTFDAKLAAHLKMLLPAAVLSGPYHDKTSSQYLVCYEMSHRLRVYASKDATKYFVFERIFPFSEQERGFISKIVQEIHDSPTPETTAAGEALIACAINRAVASHVAPKYTDAILRVIRVYEKWRNQREGLAHTIGVRFMRHTPTQSNFFNLEKDDFVKTLGSSLGTLLTINTDGGILNLEKLLPVNTDKQIAQEIFAPLAYADISAWANSWRKVAIRLTEDGSILVFNKRRLLFAKHGKYWHSLPHTMIDLELISQKIKGIEPATIKAIYLTALDLIQGGKNASVGLIRNSEKSGGPGQPDHPDQPVQQDQPNQPGQPDQQGQQGQQFGACVAERYKAIFDSTEASKYLTTMINSRKFYKIPRVIRAEICALGALLLVEGDGNILGLAPAAMEREIQETLNAAGESCGKIHSGYEYMEIFNNNAVSGLHLTVC